MQNIPYAERFGLRNISSGFTFDVVKTIDLDGYDFSFNEKPAFIYISLSNQENIINPFTITIDGKNILGNLITKVITIPAGGVSQGQYFGTDGFKNINTIVFDPNGNNVSIESVGMVFDLAQVANQNEVTKSMNNVSYNGNFNGNNTNIINLDTSLNSPENNDPNIYFKAYTDGGDNTVKFTINGIDIANNAVSEEVIVEKQVEKKFKLSKAYKTVTSVEAEGIESTEKQVSIITPSGTGVNDFHAVLDSQSAPLGDYVVEIINHNLNLYTANTISPVPFNDGDIVYGVTSGETGIVRFHSNENYILIERTSANDFTHLEEIRVSPDTGASLHINVTGLLSDLFEFTTPTTSKKGACFYDMVLDGINVVFDSPVGHITGDLFEFSVDEVPVSLGAGSCNYYLEKIQNKIAGLINYRVNVLDLAQSYAISQLGENADCGATYPGLLCATTFGSFVANPFKFNWVIETKDRTDKTEFYVHSSDTTKNNQSNINYETRIKDDFFSDYGSLESANLININLAPSGDRDGNIYINLSEFTEDYVSPYPTVIVDNEEQKFALVLDKSGDEYSAVGWFSPNQGGIRQFIDIPLNVSGANITMSKSFINNSPRFSIEIFNN